MQRLLRKRRNAVLQRRERASELRQLAKMLFSLELSYLQYDDNRGQTGRVKKGLANWIDAGGHAYLVTFTNSHHKGDNLGDLLQGQKKKAFVKFWENAKLKKCLNA